MGFTITNKITLVQPSRVQPRPILTLEEISNVTAAWLFDEASGTSVLDSSGNSRNSTSTAGSSIQSGKFGNCRALTNQSIQFGNVNLIGSGSQVFTISQWFYYTAIPGDGQYTIMCRLRQDSQFFIGVYRSGGVAYLYPSFRGSAQIGRSISGFINNNAWNHMSVSYNGGNKSLADSYVVYLNGLLFDNRTTNFGNAGGSSNDTALGMDGGEIGLITPKIDETFITTQVLSQSTITSIYNNRITSSGGSTVQIVAV